MIARPLIAADGPQTIAECRRILEYHECEVERLSHRIEQIGAWWQKREHAPDAPRTERPLSG